MKFRSIILIAALLFLSIHVALAQCNRTVKVNATNTDALHGNIQVKIKNSQAYTYTLYGYQNGMKQKLIAKSGSDEKIQFNGLAVNQYYRVELNFKHTDALLCKSWVSELIEFKD